MYLMSHSCVQNWGTSDAGDHHRGPGSICNRSCPKPGNFDAVIAVTARSDSPVDLHDNMLTDYPKISITAGKYLKSMLIHEN